MVLKKYFWSPLWFLLFGYVCLFAGLYPNLSAAEDPPLEPGAEHQCEAEISYIWTKINYVRKKDPKTVKEETVFEPGPTEEEFFATVGETGQVKTEVAHRLEVKLPSIQDEAMNYCRQTHQNLTSCIGSWLDSSTNDYLKMDFELQKKLLSSIKERCENLFGLCVDTKSTAVKCYVSRSPDVKKTEEEAGTKSADKGKGKAPAKK